MDRYSGIFIMETYATYEDALVRAKDLVDDYFTEGFKFTLDVNAEEVRLLNGKLVGYEVKFDAWLVDEDTMA